MAKRFTDTLIWEKEWFMKLAPKHKCLFRYLVDRCDASGVWEPNWTLASIYVNDKCDQSDLMVLNDQVELLPNGKIWVKDFIVFQYGKLSEKSPAHIPVFKAIEKNNLTHRVLNSLSNRLEEKEKETDKEEEKVKEKEKEIAEKEIEPVIMFPFNSDIFLNQWQLWKQYKKTEWKFNYKSLVSEQAALKELSDLSRGNESDAIEIIGRSIAKGWKGFFELEKTKQQNGKQPGITLEGTIARHNSYSDRPGQGARN